MTEDEFESLYWKQYLMIEKEFKLTEKYVTIDRLNFKSYSDSYGKLLLQIGSEIDVVAKKLCNEINANATANTIDQYAPLITGHFSEFTQVTVTCRGIDLNPWKGWTSGTSGTPGSPVWWRVYNGVKHNRNKTETYMLLDNSSVTDVNYKLANQGNVINALAGLYQLEQYFYSIILHDVRVDTPIPGSRLFRLMDHGWENKRFGKDALVYVNEADGCLYRIEPDIFYTDI